MAGCPLAHHHLLPRFVWGSPVPTFSSPPRYIEIHGALGLSCLKHLNDLVCLVYTTQRRQSFMACIGPIGVVDLVLMMVRVTPSSSTW